MWIDYKDLEIWWVGITIPKLLRCSRSVISRYKPHVVYILIHMLHVWNGYLYSDHYFSVYVGTYSNIPSGYLTQPWKIPTINGGFHGKIIYK